MRLTPKPFGYCLISNTSLKLLMTFSVVCCTGVFPVPVDQQEALCRAVLDACGHLRQDGLQGSGDGASRQLSTSVQPHLTVPAAYTH